MTGPIMILMTQTELTHIDIIDTYELSPLTREKVISRVESIFRLYGVPSFGKQYDITAEVISTLTEDWTPRFHLHMEDQVPGTDGLTWAGVIGFEDPNIVRITSDVVDDYNYTEVSSNEDISSLGHLDPDILSFLKTISNGHVLVSPNYDPQISLQQLKSICDQLRNKMGIIYPPARPFFINWSDPNPTICYKQRRYTDQYGPDDWFRDHKPELEEMTGGELTRGTLQNVDRGLYMVLWRRSLFDEAFPK